MKHNFFLSAPKQNQPKVQTKRDAEKPCVKGTPVSKPTKAVSTSSKDNLDTQSQCSSTHSTKSFKTVSFPINFIIICPFEK